MPIIRVVRPFLLNRGDNKLVQFLAGTYDVDEATAEHWYVKAHLEGAVAPEPPNPYQQRQLHIEQAVRMNEPVAAQTQDPAPPPPSAAEVQPARTGEVPEGAHYFAGGPQHDRPMPTPEQPLSLAQPQRRPPPPPRRPSSGG